MKHQDWIMLSISALTIKKTITLFVLVGPVSMIPIFLAAPMALICAARFALPEL